MPENLSMPSTSLSRRVVPLTLDLNLHKFQEIVDNSKARFIYLICGRQWGKTMLMAWKMTKAIARPHSAAWYVTNQLKQAKDTIWPKFLQILAPSEAQFKADNEELELDFNNQSVIKLKHTKDPTNRRGPSLDFLGIDEAQDFNGDDFDVVFRPLLSAKQAPCLFAGTLKAGSWFHKEWLAANRGDRENSAAFWFPSTSNPLIPASEWNSIRLDLERKGRLDIWENEYICDPLSKNSHNFEIKYMEFERVKHVCPPIAFPPDYRHFFALDWGMSDKHPCAAVWAAVSPAGKVYVYDEHTSFGLSAQNFATAVLQRGTGRKIEAFVLSEDCWSQESDRRTIALKLMGYGLRPAVKGRREDKAGSGANAVKNYLKPVQGEPLLQIFPNCTGLIDELESLRWSDKLNDDRSDALRYLLVFLSGIKFDTQTQETAPVYKRIEPRLYRYPQEAPLRFNPEHGYFD